MSITFIEYLKSIYISKTLVLIIFKGDKLIFNLIYKIIVLHFIVGKYI